MPSRNIALLLTILLVAATATATDWGLPGVGQVEPNAYGYGTNMDQFGRAHSYRDAQGRPLDSMYQDTVRRDAYGYGVHMDQFGNRVFDGQPRWQNTGDN